MSNSELSKIESITIMNLDVILTFYLSETEELEGEEERQEWFNIPLYILSDDSAVPMLHREFFSKLSKICDELERDITKLEKISTSANWSIFKEATGNMTLLDYGHRCKWWFNSNKVELDTWEKSLQRHFGIGASLK
jgi:hypothetical protein